MNQRSRARRDRPSVVVVLLMLVGTWAAVATSAPTASAETSGSFVVEAQNPAAVLRLAVDGGEANNGIETTLSWILTSSSGVEPELSVVGLESTRLERSAPSTPSVFFQTPEAGLELTVINIDETGPVTVDWEMFTSVEGSDLELEITADVSFGQPSSQVSLPAVGTRFGRLEGPFSVYEVDVEFARSSALTIGRTDRGTEANVQVVSGGGLIPVGPGRSTVPTDGATCGAERCVVSFTLTVESGPQIDMQSSDQEASITAVSRLPLTEVVWVSVPSLRLLSEVTDIALSVAIPANPGNPFANDVMLIARVADEADDAVQINCFARFEYSVGGKPFAELLSFVRERSTGRSLQLPNGTATNIDLRVGSTDPGQYCDGDADHESTLEIGVVTFGVSAVSAAEISLR